MADRRAVEAVLHRLLARVEEDGSVVVSAQEVEDWPAGVLDVLVARQLLREGTNAQLVRCPACEEACVVQPKLRILPDGSHQYIHACLVQDDIGLVGIDAGLLRRWQQDLAGLAQVVRDSLPVGGTLTCIEEDRLWYVGRTFVRNKRPVDLFLGRQLEARDAELIGSRVSPGVDVFVLTVHGGPNWIRPFAGGPACAGLEEALEIRAERTVIPPAFIERALLAIGTGRKVVPFPTPKGATWSKVIIRFVDDQNVDIEVLGVKERHSYADMGMADSRRGVPSEAWMCLWKMADSRGSIGGRRVEYDEMLKSHLRLLRKALRQYFEIPGNPMSGYSKKKRCWRSRFVVSPPMR